ncbi:hypothetical protein BDQ17DRAFT_1356861 [Cyathus striatus]|nr:hypothetical protein BDQ17DRAFT_1356861 [Cyathus striatus]
MVRVHKDNIATKTGKQILTSAAYRCLSLNPLAGRCSLLLLINQIYMSCFPIMTPIFTPFFSSTSFNTLPCPQHHANWRCHSVTNGTRLHVNLFVPLKLPREILSQWRCSAVVKDDPAHRGLCLAWVVKRLFGLHPGCKGGDLKKRTDMFNRPRKLGSTLRIHRCTYPLE